MSAAQAAFEVRLPMIVTWAAICAAVRLHDTSIISASCLDFLERQTCDVDSQAITET